MGGYVWIPTDVDTCQELEHVAVHAGREGSDGSPIYIGRASYDGGLIPCKVVPRTKSACLSYDGKEINVHCFELYCKADSKIEWVCSSDGDVPPGAVATGTTGGGEALYVGRAMHEGTMTPGRVQPSLQSLLIPFGNEEVVLGEYEVMVLKKKKSECN